jgi:hypothetical protein
MLRGGGHISTAADVYSFGVVLLEIFIERRPTDDMFKDGMSIAKFMEINFPDNSCKLLTHSCSKIWRAARRHQWPPRIVGYSVCSLC